MPDELQYDSHVESYRCYQRRMDPAWHEHMQQLRDDYSSLRSGFPPYRVKGSNFQPQPKDTDHG